MANHCEISIVIPVFNEAAELAELLGKIHALKLAQAEVIVVDDGSTDDSAEIALRAARGRLIALMDGDGQHKHENIPHLLAETSNYHMVVGARSKGSKLRLHQYAANAVYNLLASYMTRFKVEDLTSGFRVLSRRHALHFIDLLPNTFSYPTTPAAVFIDAARQFSNVLSKSGLLMGRCLKLMWLATSMSTT